jgi:hypothetical protein
MLSKEVSSLPHKKPAPRPLLPCLNAPLTTRSWRTIQYVGRGIAKKQGLPLFDLTVDRLASANTFLPARVGPGTLMVKATTYWRGLPAEPS